MLDSQKKQDASEILQYRNNINDKGKELRDHCNNLNRCRSWNLGKDVKKM